MDKFKRLLKFSIVGTTGLGVHLSLLALLTRSWGFHYLPATLVAVEMSVLHKFVWHRRWTWADRRSPASSQPWTVLWRFHLAQGFVSIGGNLLSAGILSGLWHLDPAIAGVAAMVEELIEIAGGDPSFPELRMRKNAPDRVIDPSSVIPKDPEVIVGSWCGVKVNKATIRSRPGWNSISAVRNNHIYEKNPTA